MIKFDIFILHNLQLVDRYSKVMAYLIKNFKNSEGKM